MEAYTWPDGETGYTNGTIDLNYSPETPPRRNPHRTHPTYQEIPQL